MAVSAVKKEAKPDADAEAAAPAPKKRSLNLKLIIGVLCIVGAAGGGAYWWLHRHHDESSNEAKVEPEKPPVFLPLDNFVVNLQLEENPQYLQVGLTLKVADAPAVDAVKLHMPEVRDAILLLLAGQKASTLLTLDGKRKLALDILKSVNLIVAPAAMESLQKAAAPAVVVADAKATAADAKPADGDAKPEGETEADKPAEGAGADADAKGAPAGGDKAAAAASKLPVQNVLFTSFIVQ